MQRLCCADHTDNMCMWELTVFMFYIHIKKESDISAHAYQNCQPVSASYIGAGPGRWVPSGFPAVLRRSLQLAFLCHASPCMPLPAHPHVTCIVANCAHMLIRTCSDSQVGMTLLHKVCQLELANIGRLIHASCICGPRLRQHTQLP